MRSHASPGRAEARLLLSFALAATLCALPYARAQGTKAAKPKDAPKAAKAAPTKVDLKEPVAFRVYQRDRDGRADIAVVPDPAVEGARIVSATVVQGNMITESIRFDDGKLRNVPTGGPYTITANIRVGNASYQVTVPNVLVGDLWVLAGQSNMEGVGDLVNVTPPDPQVALLGMNGQWSRAEEPLHWLVDSPDPVHSGNPADRAKRAAEQHRTRTKGASLGLPFAVALVQAARVPVGLVAAAHGGTSMGQWDPKKKGEGGNSLYGSFLRQVTLAGGKVKGVLWYQGESDANGEAAKIYPKVFADFIAAVRNDLGQPDLPFYFVQIGRFIRGGDPAPWNAVQEAERRLAESVPNTAVVPAIDLELDDGIHVGTQGQKRVGQRLAKIALRELYGQAGATIPTFDRVNKGAGNTLVVKFKGVNIVAGPASGASPMTMNPGTPAVYSVPGTQGSGMMMSMGRGRAEGSSPGVVGLKPARHIGGFSIRKPDGTDIPLIFDAAVGNARDTVILKLNGPLPEKAVLWYGHGYDPYCNLTDGLDMAIPVFGPIPLGDVK
jgi:sialate O-acetylesterase